MRRLICFVRGHDFVRLWCPVPEHWYKYCFTCKGRFQD